MSACLALRLDLEFACGVPGVQGTDSTEHGQQHGVVLLSRITLQPCLGVVSWAGVAL
jgi:hypothetical protein